MAEVDALSVKIGLGDKVTPRYERLTDYEGEEFYRGEVGEVRRATRSTIDVVDPRGHLHKGRYRYFFQLAAAREAQKGRGDDE